MAAGAKLAVLLPLIMWNIVLIPCILPWRSESRTVAPPRLGNDDEIVLLTAAANGTTEFSSVSDASVQYYCDETCNDKTCHDSYPTMCEGVKPGRTSEKDDEGGDGDDQYEYYTCYVGCWCPDKGKDGGCCCLCRKEPPPSK